VEGREVRYPDYTRALVKLSRGGGDAVVVREFDLEGRRS
jgi:prolyl oligopeptidase